MGREVALDNAGGNNGVAANIAERTEGLKHEGVRVEPTFRVPLIAIEEHILASRIRAVESGARVGLVSARSDGLRETGLECEDRTKLPPSEDSAENATFIHEPPPFAHRQVVEHRCHAPVRHVETRQTALRAEVIAVLWEQRVAGVISYRASCVDRTRPRVAERVSQTLRRPSLQLYRQRVVIRSTASIDLLDSTEFRIGRALQYAARRAWKRLVEGS